MVNVPAEMRTSPARPAPKLEESICASRPLRSGETPSEFAAYPDIDADTRVIGCAESSGVEQRAFDHQAAAADIDRSAGISCSGDHCVAGDDDFAECRKSGSVRRRRKTAGLARRSSRQRGQCVRWGRRETPGCPLMVRLPPIRPRVLPLETPSEPDTVMGAGGPRKPNAAGGALVRMLAPRVPCVESPAIRKAQVIGGTRIERSAHVQAAHLGPNTTPLGLMR